MNALSISVELCSLAFESPGQEPQDRWIDRIKNLLANYPETVGHFLHCSSTREVQLEGSLSLAEYLLTFEKQSLRLAFAGFRDRDQWEIQDMKLLPYIGAA